MTDQKKIDEQEIVENLAKMMPNVSRKDIRNVVKTFKRLNEKEDVYCNFCGKHQKEVQKIIAGPGIFICNECVDQCHEIIHPEVKNDEA